MDRVERHCLRMHQRALSAQSVARVLRHPCGVCDNHFASALRRVDSSDDVSENNLWDDDGEFELTEESDLPASDAKQSTNTLTLTSLLNPAIDSISSTKLASEAATPALELESAKPAPEVATAASEPVKHASEVATPATEPTAPPKPAELCSVPTSEPVPLLEPVVQAVHEPVADKANSTVLCFACPHCDNKLLGWSTLRGFDAHRKSLHGKDANFEPVTRMIDLSISTCPVCSHRSPSRVQLLKHIVRAYCRSSALFNAKPVVTVSEKRAAPSDVERKPEKKYKTATALNDQRPLLEALCSATGKPIEEVQRNWGALVEHGVVTVGDLRRLDKNFAYKAYKTCKNNLVLLNAMCKLYGSDFEPPEQGISN
jgi:hypothetical protein